MAKFVLVHGAWHGGWCWRETAQHLSSYGHRVHTPTLTGLADRAHLMRDDIVPDTHVTDIAELIRWNDLRDVILLGHSYGGMVITGVAGQMPERIRALVYLDAFVPEQSGASLFANANPERMARFQAQIDAGAMALEPDLFDAWSEDESRIAWLKSMCTPQPKGTFTHGVTLTGREAEVTNKHFILCARNSPSAFEAEYAKLDGRSDWTRATIDTKHDAMVDAPERLADMLDTYASSTH